MQQKKISATYIHDKGLVPEHKKNSYDSMRKKKMVKDLKTLHKRNYTDDK